MYALSGSSIFFNKSNRIGANGDCGLAVLSVGPIVSASKLGRYSSTC